jgi:hypothetical protein
MVCKVLLRRGGWNYRRIINKRLFDEVINPTQQLEADFVSDYI